MKPEGKIFKAGGVTLTASCDYNAYNEDFTHETPEMARFGEYLGGSCDQKAYKGVFSHETLGGGDSDCLM